MHTLVGESRYNRRGQKVVTGFHHEPSVQSLGIQDTYALPSDQDTHPFDTPYKAKVVINGLHKYVTRYHKKKPQLLPAVNTFFPTTYSALDVLHVVDEAYHKRDHATDRMHTLPNGSLQIVSTGSAFVGGEALGMTFILDMASETIQAAIPGTENTAA